jgi:hypothetical protein
VGTTSTVNKSVLLRQTEFDGDSEPADLPMNTGNSGGADMDDPVFQLQTEDSLSDLSCRSDSSAISKRSKCLLQEAERSAPVINVDRIKQKSRQGRPASIIGLENFDRPPPKFQPGSSGAARTSVMVRLGKRSTPPQEPPAAAAVSDDEPPVKKSGSTSSRVTVSMTSAQFANYRRYNTDPQD